MNGITMIVKSVHCFLNSRQKVVTKVTFTFDAPSGDQWPMGGLCFHVDDVVIEYDGEPRHKVGDRFDDPIASTIELLMFGDPVSGSSGVCPAPDMAEKEPA